jgi:peptide-methionine (S)-S-oxide reductase
MSRAATISRTTALACLVLGMGLAAPAPAAKAYFAGGCFWCMEADFEKLPGVGEVVSGFSGGTAANPTYHGDHTGHYETVEVDYDPAVVSYGDLLDHFWKNIDPFDDGGQFCDRGSSYLSAIFVANEAERRLAEASKADVQQRFPGRQIVTPILDAATFYPVQGDEAYHQDYYKKNPVRYRYYRWGCGRDQRLSEIWGS